MAQFAGKRGTGWLWIVVALIVILAIAAYVLMTNPALSSMLPGYGSY